MRQHKAGERKAAQRWSSRTQKARTAPPCSPAAGRNRALRHEFGKERLLHKQSAFLRRAPPSANIACAERPFTCRPRSGRKFSTDGQKVRSKLKEEAEKGSGKCAQMARPIIRRSYLQCLGPLGFPVGMPALVMALGVLLQCHSSWPDAAVYLHMAGSAVSVQAAAAAIAAAATRDASASLSAATVSDKPRVWSCRLGSAG